MSYCRFSEGDVYLIGTIRGTREEFYCCGCLLNPKEWHEEDGHFLGGYLRSINNEEDFHSPSRAETYRHLEAHVAAGHHVPDRALDGIAAETEWGVE